VRSTAGQLFEITFSADGTAKASLRNDMTGNWKEEGQRRGHLENRLDHKNHQEGDHYKQSAYRKGKSLDGTNNTSEEKLVSSPESANLCRRPGTRRLVINRLLRLYRLGWPANMDAKSIAVVFSGPVA
jgi:hypothetical protein